MFHRTSKRQWLRIESVRYENDITPTFVVEMNTGGAPSRYEVRNPVEILKMIESVRGELDEAERTIKNTINEVVGS